MQEQKAIKLEDKEIALSKSHPKCYITNNGANSSKIPISLLR